MQMAGRFRFKSEFNVNRIVKRLVRTILALYVGGTVLSVFGTVMVNTSSPFYTGLSLIGWTIGSSKVNGTDYGTVCGGATAGGTTLPTSGNVNCITSTSGSGVLAVVGIIAVAQIVTEFISW